MSYRDVPIIRNEYYHIYNRAIAGNLLFREDRNFTFFLSRIDKYILPAADLIAYCLMPNHYHFILKLVSEDLSNAMKKMALSYAKAFNLVYDQSGHLFQGPFQRVLITDQIYLVHLSRYIHLNPVKANLVKKAEEWEHSSYQAYIGLKESNLSNPLPILNLICEDSHSKIIERQVEYRNFVEAWEFEYMEFKAKR